MTRASSRDRAQALIALQVQVQLDPPVGSEMVPVKRPPLVPCELGAPGLTFCALPTRDGRSTIAPVQYRPRAHARSKPRTDVSDIVHGRSNRVYEGLRRDRSQLHQQDDRACRVGAFERSTLEHLGRMKGRRAEPGGTDSALERL